MVISLRPLKSEDSSILYHWRNSPSVSQFMYRDDPIEIEDHLRWFNSVYQDTAQSRYRIAEWNSQAVGLVSLTKIDLRQKTCEWGGYLGPEAQRGLGLGKEMIVSSLDIAFTELELNRVTVEVLVTNHRAIKLYESVGFVREGVLRERAIHADGPLDAIILSILRREWRSERKTEHEIV
jgi:UDP-4-amino-4,6-dideoxy-N-acetyl-beta-L-altrosamine N-acetyltransferase